MPDAWRKFLCAMPSYTIRRATTGDAATIAGHRVAMFSDMGQVPTIVIAEQLLTACTSALSQSLSAGSYLGWLALDGDHEVIAGAGAHLNAHLPRVSLDGCRIAAEPVPLIVNVYTDPQWRGQGIARALMREIMNWALARGCDRVLLHASDAGRHLYESLGFVPSNEMRGNPKAIG